VLPGTQPLDDLPGGGGTAERVVLAGTVVVGAAGHLQPQGHREVAVPAALLVGVVGVVGLDAGEPGGGHRLDQFGLDPPGPVPGAVEPRVGEHRDPTAGHQQLDGTDGVHGVLLHVRRPPIGEVAVEDLAQAARGAGLDHRRGDVGAADRRAGGERHHPLEGHLDAEVVEAPDDATRPVGALVAQPLELLGQRRVARVDPVAEHVHRPAVALGGELDAEHQLQGGAVRRRDGTLVGLRRCRGR
jgi:hypothetical protein